MARIQRDLYEYSRNDESDCRGVAAAEGQNDRCPLLLLVLTAALTEFFVRGRLSFAADLAASAAPAVSF